MLRLCELVETWIEKQVATEVEIPIKDIGHILLKLQRSPSIPRFKLIRLEIRLKDIFKNRYHVSNIVHSMNYALSHSNVSTKDLSDTSKRLRR